MINLKLTVIATLQTGSQKLDSDPWWRILVLVVLYGVSTVAHKWKKIRLGMNQNLFSHDRDTEKRKKKSKKVIRGNSSLKSTTGFNKMFPPTVSGELQFSLSTCQRGNLSEGKAIYTGIKCMPESVSDVASIGLQLFWKLGQRNRCGGGCNTH